MTIMGATFAVIFAIAFGYAALRFWRGRHSSDPTDQSNGFRARIGFTRLDGMESLSLLLANGTRKYVWAEEIEIFLSSLTAEEQTAEPSFHEIQKIRQMIAAGDTLPISLSQVIYKAAGDPQRKYSCVLSSILRYRVDEETSEIKMENYRLQMLGLTASGISRERKPVQSFLPREKSSDAPAVVTKQK
jgi:hypothetical protein